MNEQEQAEQQRGVFILGGEGSHRGFWGEKAKGRGWGVVIILVIAFIFVPSFGWPPIVLGVLAAGVLVLITSATHNGSILERRVRRKRHRESVKTRSGDYHPYDQQRVTMLTAALEQTAKTKDKAERAARVEWARELAAMRATPDGADGMGWLQSARGIPGIAWHGPVGEDPYLSVAFAVSGQLRGMESPDSTLRKAEGFGALLAGRAAPGSLLRFVQPVTRILPADTALQEWWVMTNIDDEAPEWAKKSYEEVLMLSGTGAMVQRHYVVASWPLNARFAEKARKFGEGRDGWRRLMAAEIESAQRGLHDAYFGEAVALTARGTTAVIRHMQNPSRPLDLVRDLAPTDLGERARGGEFSAHVVEGIDPETGAPVEWWHRTAAIRADHLSVAQRTPLWLLPLLTGSKLDVIRTVSFHIELIPASEARRAARKDLVADMATEHAQTAGGRIPLDEGSVRVLAAQRRRNDLAEGGGHHGTNWIGYVTITSDSKEQLALDSRELEELCDTDAGIHRLEWLDSYQSAASGLTWPIGRGIKPDEPTWAARTMRMLAGKGEKEAIS
ncbi:MULTISPECIES: SCO6880 family protein [Microbacterium]|jgi:hypothetical protein|uniref:SCO6880 family protein n=1 Tax=Microbacterium TaxID=33882 RepID=UPI0005ACF233|nr:MULTISPECIES: SCO6880 family protein [unclassified Microbacterium]KIP89921.1 hypothetical protein RU09_12215 [Microbacterium sp. MEJ108Y]QEA29846.1 hypothetical protein FGL91_15575 [Microbacterium sp. CBA3102]